VLAGLFAGSWQIDQILSSSLLFHTPFFCSSRKLQIFTYREGNPIQDRYDLKCPDLK